MKQFIYINKIYHTHKIYKTKDFIFKPLLIKYITLLIHCLKFLEMKLIYNLHFIFLYMEYKIR